MRLCTQTYRPRQDSTDSEYEASWFVATGMALGKAVTRSVPITWKMGGLLTGQLVLNLPTCMKTKMSTCACCHPSRGLPLDSVVKKYSDYYDSWPMDCVREDSEDGQ